METLFKAFRQAGHELFLVGGVVRDRLLGKESNDIDFATSALPEETINVLSACGLKAIPIGIEFGTVQTVVDGVKVEITTYRCAESYTKGSRKPGVTFGKKIEEDLARRDFTFNAIAMREDGSLVDPFRGAEDLKAGIIRTPIDPAISFGDDPLRMLRACRFAARGMGLIEPDTFHAMMDHATDVLTVSAERVFEEVTKLLMAKDPGVGLIAMERSGLLKQWFPELQVVADFREEQGKYHHLPVWEHTLEVVQVSHASPTVRWAALFHDVAKPQTWSRKGSDVHFYQHDRLGSEVWEAVADRLKTSTEFKEHVSQLIYEHQNVRGAMGDKAIRRLMHRMGDRLQDLFYLRQADIIGHKPSLMQSSLDDLNQLVRRVNSISDMGPVSHRLPAGTGTRIAEALGIKPGKELGVIMHRLQEMMVDGELNAESDLVAEARRIHAKEVT